MRTSVAALRLPWPIAMLSPFVTALMPTMFVAAWPVAMLLTTGALAMLVARKRPIGVVDARAPVAEWLSRVGAATAGLPAARIPDTCVAAARVPAACVSPAKLTAAMIVSAELTASRVAAPTFTAARLPRLLSSALWTRLPRSLLFALVRRPAAA